MSEKEPEGKSTNLANPNTVNKKLWLSGISANNVVKNICWLAVTATACQKLYSSEVSFTIDFPTLLSLLLAFFSVYISSQFFFKATDTSNIFYDNTYKFTQNITELLVKMESGFGEKLKHIDENYTMLRQESLFKHEKKVIKDEENKIEIDINEKLKEKEKFIEDLVKQLNISEEEKKLYIDQYKEKEEALDNLHHEMESLRRHNQLLSRKRTSIFEHNASIMDKVDSYTIEHILPRIYTDSDISSIAAIRRFSYIVTEEDPKYIDDLEELNLYRNGELTLRGRKWLRTLLRENGK